MPCPSSDLRLCHVRHRQQRVRSKRELRHLRARPGVRFQRLQRILLHAAHALSDGGLWRSRRRVRRRDLLRFAHALLLLRLTTGVLLVSLHGSTTMSPSGLHDPHDPAGPLLCNRSQYVEPIVPMLTARRNLAVAESGGRIFAIRDYGVEFPLRTDETP